MGFADALRRAVSRGSAPGATAPGSDAPGTSAWSQVAARLPSRRPAAEQTGRGPDGQPPDGADAAADTDAGSAPLPSQGPSEADLRRLLAEDPNDMVAFSALARTLDREAARRPGDETATWALAEELAHDHRAWLPYIELARLSLERDRETAMRRLHMAAERDPSGRALTQGLRLLRARHEPDAALQLGLGYWRPAQHPAVAGEELVRAAVEAGRAGEARRHLRALLDHRDADITARVRVELEAMVEDAGS